MIVAFCLHPTLNLFQIAFKRNGLSHDDVIRWKHFPRYWPFVRGIHRPVTRSFDFVFDLRLNKRLSKQSWGWWFETLPCPLWRHCNALGVSFRCIKVQWCPLRKKASRMPWTAQWLLVSIGDSCHLELMTPKWRHKSGTTLFQPVTWSRTAPSHHLKQLIRHLGYELLETVRTIFLTRLLVN